MEITSNPQHDNEKWKSNYHAWWCWDTPAPNDTSSLKNTPPTQSILEEDGEITAKFSKDPNPQRDLAEIQEHFQQLQE